MFSRLSELLVQFRKALTEYNDAAERYKELESSLLQLVNSAIAEGDVKIKSASDIRHLVDAITRMMETRAKLTSILVQASATMKDIITAQAAAEAVLSTSAQPASLPSVKVAMIVEHDEDQKSTDSESKVDASA
ncbi:MAG: hypothetical protein QXH03_10380 [Candidatus Bathyarchaeia archaeon]